MRMRTLAWSVLAFAAAGAATSCSGILTSGPAKAHDVVAVGAGADFTCALVRSGRVLCWGRNDVGQLGRGSSDTLAHPEPHLVVLPQRATRITVGYDHACAIDEDGRAWCWGDDRMFESGATSAAERCGTGADEAACRTRPVRVAAPSPFALIGAGFRRSCGTMTDGITACWGSAGEGNEPSDSASIERCGPPNSASWCRRAPTRVPLQLEQPPPRPPIYAALTTLSVGAFATCGTTIGNVLLCWGRGTRPSWNPNIGPSGLGVASTSIGYVHACVLREDLVVLCWSGTRELGVLGTDPSLSAFRYTSYRTTRAVEDGHHFSAVTAGGLHSCALEATSHAAYCWGANQYGQLGRGSVDTLAARDVRGSNPLPAVVAGAQPYNAISAGLDHTCAVSASGDVWCWGRTGRGATGRMGAPNQAVPMMMP